MQENLFGRCAFLSCQRFALILLKFNYSPEACAVVNITIWNVSIISYLYNNVILIKYNILFMYINNIL